MIAQRLLLSCILLLPTQSQAQTPQRTTATYGDWTVTCVTDQGKKSCAVAQSQTIQGQRTPASEIRIGRATKGDSFRLFVQVPASVWLPSQITFFTNEIQRDLTANFILCTPARCVAAAELTDENIKNLRSQSAPGKLVYKNASQADVSIPVSFSGLGDALDALQKE